MAIDQLTNRRADSLPKSQDAIIRLTWTLRDVAKGASKRSSSFTRRLFLACVVTPTLAAALYYGLIAGKMYVSEADFIVRGSGAASTTGLASLFRTFGLARTDDDTYAVQSFMRSRDAVRELRERLPLEEMFGRPEGDRFARYPLLWRGASEEALFEYYRGSIDINYNASTGIARLTVTAFRADDAHRLGVALLDAAENFVNRINARAQRDTLEYAKEEMSLAEKKVIEAQAKISEFRNQELLFDPGSASEKSLEIVAQLAGELVRTQTAIQELKASAPFSPSLQTLQERARIIKAQIEKEKRDLTGNGDSLTAKIGAYERLVAAREFADRALTSASGALELARQEARRQQIYLETIAKPGIPDEAILPRRLRSVFSATVVGFCVFGALWFLYAASKEHLQEIEREL